MARRTTDPDEGPSDSIAAGLFKLALVLRNQSWKASGERGLTPTQAQILARLAALPTPVGVKVIAEQLAITAGTASAAVTTLEEKGLITKQPSPDDGRALLLKLTRTGRAEARRATEWPEVLVEAADALPASDQAGLVRGLVGMIRELQERGAVPLPRMCVGCRFFRPNKAPKQARPHYCEYIDAPIGDAELRVDCNEMEPVDDARRDALWKAFTTGTPLANAPN